MKCPRCGSSLVWKDGIRQLKNGSVQRYLCRKCGYRFSENSLKDCSVSVNREGRSLMTSAIVQKTSKVVGGRDDLINFLWWMKKQNYSEATIRSKSEILQMMLRRGVNLNDGESVKEFVARYKCSPGRKANIIYAYLLYAKWKGIEWAPPRILIPEKLPFIPSEAEINNLIAGTSRYISVFLQIAKETGARAGEIWNLKWSDIDFQNATIRIVAEKGSHARIFRMSSKLIQMLNRLPRKGEGIFSSHYSNLRSLRRTFEKQRKRLAEKMGNPRLLRIHFHTIRHWKGTMEYYNTKDILHVMQVLGHKRIQNTLKYTQLAKFQDPEKYICKVAKTSDEIKELIEAGFEFVCQQNGLAFFRKPK